MNDNAPIPAAGTRPRPRQRDLTSGPVLQTLVLFSLPTLGSNLLQSLNGTVNSIWVGRLIGDAALAATANANIVMFLVFAGVFGFGMAATVKMGQAFGAGEVDAARRTFGSAVGLCLGLAITVALAGWVFAPQLLTALATPGESYGLALEYLRIIFISIPGGMLTVMIAMGLRGAGDSRTPFLFMGVSVALDVALNPLLISGIGPFPRMGIAGSAASTAFAGYAALLALLAYVYVKDLPLRLRGAEMGYLIPRRAELGYIVGKGLPMGAQMLLVSSAGIVVIGLVNREGLMAAAAYGASLQLWTYLQMPAMAIGAGTSAMAAQAIGAGMTGRIDAISRAGILINLCLTGTMTAVLLLFDRAALELFLGSNSPAVALARHIQFLASWNFILFGVTIVLFGTMRAGGVVWVPLVALGIALFPARLGFYYVFRDMLGQDALWLCFPFGSLVSMGIAIWFYRRPGWRTKGRAISPERAAEESHTDGEAAGRFKPEL
ncbi:MATE family efflux transporter [Tsuneonella deserti]|uniref:MATE family efflux transporter n=1 Tax=Tsuneonella deserti TaxID=2035528 RepID=A0ABQ1S8Z7_9SPHN|nr:MATE family efflux transporter [Tsuneonella deserti]GGD99009.1 MATE family efflux transporter [Tsuneonella deserti]